MAVLLFVTAINVHAELPTYLFLDFEVKSGWTTGLLSVEEQRIQLLQGNAEVLPLAESESGQILSLSAGKPFTAVSIDASPLAGSREVFCEVLARPYAIDTSKDEEFFDFAGAILGLFRVGDYGELMALFSQSEEESVWISTGLRFTLDERGAVTDWIQLNVRIEPETGRWALAVNGQWELEGMKMVELEGEVALPLYLYGHESHGNRFDDVLLSDVPPEQLEMTLKRLASERLSRRPAPMSSPQMVTHTKPLSELRRAEPAMRPSRVTDSPPILLGWHLSMDTGQRTYKSSTLTDRSAGEPSIIAYAPGYDDEGNPLPATLTITADAALRPGVNLSRLRWRVMELVGWPDQFGQQVGAGDFRGGLVQHFVLTPEWTRKATSVQVYMD